MFPSLDVQSLFAAILHHYWRQERKELYIGRGRRITLHYVTLHYIMVQAAILHHCLETREKVSFTLHYSVVMIVTLHYITL